MTPAEQEAALKRVFAELDETRQERDALRSVVENAAADVLAGVQSGVERLHAELDKVKADFANACDVGRRQEARADRAEAQRDRLRAALGDLLEEYASNTHLPAAILDAAEAALEETK